MSKWCVQPGLQTVLMNAPSFVGASMIAVSTSAVPRGCTTTIASLALAFGAVPMPPIKPSLVRETIASTEATAPPFSATLPTTVQMVSFFLHPTAINTVTLTTIAPSSSGQGANAFNLRMKCIVTSIDTIQPLVGGYCAPAWCYTNSDCAGTGGTCYLFNESRFEGCRQGFVVKRASVSTDKRRKS